MLTALLPIVFALAVGQGLMPTQVDTSLVEARRLYAAAAYSDALARLDAIENPTDGQADEIDQYRALCLLGLSRTADAERALERIVLRTPDYRLADASVPPRLVIMFAQVRKRVLPIAARTLYAKAKTNYDLKNYPATVTRLKELLVLLKSDDLAAESDSLADLKQLADGFLRLAEAEVTAANREVYSAADKDVVPPVEIEQAFPQWSPPPSVKWRSFRGVVQVIVDEYGSVESALLAESVADFYDAPLLEAAKSWRFKPALKNGKPVKYRKLVEVIKRPQ